MKSFVIQNITMYMSVMYGYEVVTKWVCGNTIAPITLAQVALFSPNKYIEVKPTSRVSSILHSKIIQTVISDTYEVVRHALCVCFVVMDRVPPDSKDVLGKDC